MHVDLALRRLQFHPHINTTESGVESGRSNSRWQDEQGASSRTHTNIVRSLVSSSLHTVPYPIDSLFHIIPVHRWPPCLPSTLEGRDDATDLRSLGDLVHDTRNMTSASPPVYPTDTVSVSHSP